MIEHVIDQLRLLLKPHPGWYGLVAALLLAGLGILAIDTVAPDKAQTQAQFWLPVALIVMAAFVLPYPRAIGLATYPALITIIVLLAMMPLMPGSIVPLRNGARCWIDLGPMSLQPAELAKIFFVLALARYLRFRDSYRTLRGLLPPFLIMFIPVALLLKQPDLGTAILFGPALFVMLVAAGAKLRHLGALLAIGLLVITINVLVIAMDAPQWMRLLKPHQEARIAAMLHPEKHRNSDGYQQRIAVSLVGAGGVQGLGAERAATVLKFNHLPERDNDMIFAVIVNRWGAAGGVAVMGLYLVLVTSFALVAARTKDPFARLACAGFGGMIFVQAAINIAVTTGLLPITGITLPFISYGGSSLVATFAMVGLMLNFACRRPSIISRPSFEFDRADAALS